MTKQKKQKTQIITQSAINVDESSQGDNTLSQTAPSVTEQKPESSQNKSHDVGTEVREGDASQSSEAPSQPQTQLSEEDRKALENLATAIGIPQIVAEIKRIGEQVNVLTGAKTGATTPAIGGAAAGFMGPIMAKAPEVIEKIIAAIEKYATGGSQPQQPTMISGIDKEIMEAAIKQTMEVKQKVALANEALAKIYMGGGSVMVDQNGNAVILKPKQKEELEKK